MATNKRIFYATQAFSLTPVKVEGDTVTVDGTTLYPGGVQSLGMNTNFNMERIFQLGQLDLYEAVDNNPQVEFTLNKVFDGTKPLFLMTMGGESSKSAISIVEGQNNRVNLDLRIYKDTDQGSAGTAVNNVRCTGLYASRFTFTFPTDGNATEEVTLVGNNKVWGDADNSSTWPTGASTVHSHGITRRWKFKDSACQWPTGVPLGGTAPKTNVTVSFDLGREPIYTLGQYDAYLRYVRFPVEVTTEITSLAQDKDADYTLDYASYSCESTSSSATSNEQITFVICADGGDELTLDLGAYNRLMSYNYTGGDTGGANVQVSYSYSNNNNFTMSAAGTWTQDPFGT